ncbi:Cysteine-rich receptor-like protein kinase 2 [Capsicum annuum]|nr:Cysteine-rich receptor-like protein kinase 2 [Capsicum annuum]
MKDLVENSQEIDWSVVPDSEISNYTQPDKIGEHSVIKKAVGKIDTNIGSTSVALVATEVLVDVGSVRKNVDDTSIGDKSIVILDDTPVVPRRIRKPAAISESLYVSKFDSGCSNVQGQPTKCIDKGPSTKHIFSIKHSFTISIIEPFLDMKLLSSFNKFVDKSLQLNSNPVYSKFVYNLANAFDFGVVTIKIKERFYTLGYAGVPLTDSIFYRLSFQDQCIYVYDSMRGARYRRVADKAVLAYLELIPNLLSSIDFRDKRSDGIPDAASFDIWMVDGFPTQKNTNNGSARAQVSVPGSSNNTAYVLADCWNTLSANSCTTCLQNASASMLGCLSWSEGKVVVIVIVVSSIIVLGVGSFIGIGVWKNKQIQKKRKGANDAEKLVEILHDISLNFKYSTLEKATGSFNEANKLGKGGFGMVYKDVLEDDREISIKRLFYNNTHRAVDFYNEVNIVSSVKHKNLTRLLGCSCSGPEILLVYEFLPNKSLDCFIFSKYPFFVATTTAKPQSKQVNSLFLHNLTDPIKGKDLNWPRRFEIIIGMAEGLIYLHENTKSQIIHRDIKASNILLDRFHSKITDFGLSRLFQEGKSHISTAISGTLGYMAPEYLERSQLMEKADVYSFGVLLLENFTRRQRTRETTSYIQSA